MNAEFNYVTITYVAALAGVSATTVWKRIAEGSGPQVVKVDGRTSVVHREEAEEWVRQNEGRWHLRGKALRASRAA